MANAPTPEDLARLAAHTERRIADLGLQYAEVARTAGFSDQTLIAIRNGAKVRPTTHRKLEKALLWAPGSVQAILNGGEPTPLNPESIPPEATEAQTRPDASTEAGPRQLQELELASRLLGATVRELGLSPEEADEAWRQVRLNIERSNQPAKEDEPSQAGTRHRAG
ncbi:hypothetical protein [Streptomyces hygroscopicus]|uniref:hypothetical protein n=1 Tax=Streptomyces hygroscopicus TaxID=1912 RepID=UPI00131D3E05|nr:hypothetical protein [Streptomyces hygroscopicus]